MKKLTALLICICIILTAFTGATASETSGSALKLKGDINADGKINVEDARSIMRVCTGDDESPAVGSVEFNAMKLTQYDESEITMEDVRAALRVATGAADMTSLYTKEQLTELFNSLVNRIKTQEFAGGNTFSIFVSQSQSADMPTYDFGEEYNEFVASFIDMDDAFDFPETVSYPYGMTKSPVTDNTYPLIADQSVSKLTAGDIDTISISYSDNANVFGSYPDRINGSDVSALKSINPEGTIVIRVKVVSEDLKNTDENSESPGDRIINYFKPSVDTDEFEVEEISSDELFTYTLQTHCAQANLDCYVDYYFDAVTLNPVSAFYSAEESITVDMRFILSVEGEGEALNGTMSQCYHEKMTTALAFDNFYK